MGIAGIWAHREAENGLPTWSMSMLIINADGDPVMQRFHKSEDEKRSVVILPDERWGDWLRAKSEEEARAMLAIYPADTLSVEAAPR